MTRRLWDQQNDSLYTNAQKYVYVPLPLVICVTPNTLQLGEATSHQLQSDRYENLNNNKTPLAPLHFRPILPSVTRDVLFDHVASDALLPS
jgi:hypothetical protein